jgi:branched-chain amino acid aminotransferase
VVLSGLRESYVAFDCLRGRPVVGNSYHPANTRNYIVAFARPWEALLPLEESASGLRVN